ncbi:RNA polymerase, sigma 28 subunit, SigD/FliA/WhiG [Nitrosomonas cryotolerans]|uniref:RNA polymerase sigma factor FliA n=1 Tax=Nitrosomonas cryotolerans ATCC 49181 TaxID=1131553 RepID=A0A1N6IJK2_9PROT|nr:RNA polymerase sigma factor FliA [Nitrosomonas cryotolerans]SFP93743.1 RNA polymerase, sigma 28 subunit, SigD/FliA/WhiG [Nitrosomonas cryotolerans]SIO32175.1 RNA polymerase, sigma 28 subunit, SigD/FliA/WhiG [Nitrosomonas cryotolerans ATCC 49181]
MYTETGTIDKEQFVTEFTPLVKRIAYHMMTKLPASVQVDDLIQVGMIGLLDAINRYEGSYGRQFESYAAQRIRGSILDELREADWLPRSIRKKMRQIETAVNVLEQRMGCAPSEQDLASELNISLDEYHVTLQNARGAQLIFYEDFQGDDEEPFLDRLFVDKNNDPLNTLLDESLRLVLVNAIDNLPPREKMVMGMHYEHEMNLREIGEVLGVSESRVCQLHTQAVARLRSRLRNT